ncbi:MAG: hypothetical protein NZT92_20380 [Abditibacteriales bacterium]|nr:hypothetical protein [Abditibacteriales bacterium]MDW8364967.1 hypothetical protein [Abditibacteriales bacterium]
MKQALQVMVALVLLLVAFAVVNNLIHTVAGIVKGLVTIALWAVIIYFAVKIFGGRGGK